MKWNPFAALQQQRTQDIEDAEAQALLADAMNQDGDAEPDDDQGQSTNEPPRKPPDMNDWIRGAAGYGPVPRDRRGNRIPEVGGD